MASNCRPTPRGNVKSVTGRGRGGSQSGWCLGHRRRALPHAHPWAQTPLNSRGQAGSHGRRGDAEVLEPQPVLPWPGLEEPRSPGSTWEYPARGIHRERRHGQGSIIPKGECSLHPHAGYFLLACSGAGDKAPGTAVPGGKEYTMACCPLPEDRGRQRLPTSQPEANTSDVAPGPPSCSRRLWARPAHPWVPLQSLSVPHRISLRLLTWSRSRPQERDAGNPEGSALPGRPSQSLLSLPRCQRPCWRQGTMPVTRSVFSLAGKSGASRGRAV